MNIQDFFDLPEDQRDYMVEMHRKQKMIRMTRDAINGERGRLDTQELNNQENCSHPFAKEKYVAHENEYGNLTGGGTTWHHCQDCNARWMTEK